MPGGGKREGGREGKRKKRKKGRREKYVNSTPCFITALLHTFVASKCSQIAWHIPTPSSLLVPRPNSSTMISEVESTFCTMEVIVTAVEQISEPIKLGTIYAGFSRPLVDGFTPFG